MNYLKRPSDACKTPAKNVAVKAKWRKSFGFSLKLTTRPNMEAIRSDPTATVPTAKSLELPIIA